MTVAQPKVGGEPARQDARVKRNAFMRVRFTDPPQLDLLLENLTFDVLNPDVLRAVVLAEEEVAATDLLERIGGSSGSTPPMALISELSHAGILVSPGYRHPLQTAAEHWQKRGWLDALVLHLRSRDIEYGDFGQQNFIRFAPPEREGCGPVATADTPTPSRPEDIELEVPAEDPFGKCVFDVMAQRRSGQPWRAGSVDRRALGNILYTANAESRRNRTRMDSPDLTDERALFDCSSFSALETYTVVNEVVGIPSGVYGYDVEKHKLRLLCAGDYRERLVEMCIGQGKVRGCAAAFLIGARWSRYFTRYRHSRAYRNLLINTAELAHYYILGATAANLSNFITPAFRDEVAEGIVQEPSTKVGPLYMVAIG